MPLSIVRHSEPSYIEAAFAGPFSSTELTAAAEQVRVAAREHETRCILADCTDLLTGGHTLTDLYRIAESSGEGRQQLREALLRPTSPTAVEYVRFWEDVCRNRGMAVRVFEDRAAALAWLFDTQAS